MLNSSYYTNLLGLCPTYRKFNYDVIREDTNHEELSFRSLGGYSHTRSHLKNRKIVIAREPACRQAGNDRSNLIFSLKIRDCFTAFAMTEPFLRRPVVLHQLLLLNSFFDVGLKLWRTKNRNFICQAHYKSANSLKV